MDDELAWLDATAQAELVHRREVSARELVETAIARIEAINPAVNAVIHPDFDSALDRPGVPFLVKDALATEAGRPYHSGLRAARDAGHTATSDAWLVERYRAAGLVSLGRTNTPELASSTTTEPLAYGPTRNPWDPTRTPGGSSGGSAAAVASGMVTAAHGSDMGGSIRIPASHCGLVGLKPTRARISLGPAFGEYWGPVAHQHVLTRSVRDSASILDATAGPAPGDPYTAPPSPTGRPWLVEVASDPGRQRIGFRTRLPDGSAPHPEVTFAVETTAKVLESLDHHIEPAELACLDDDGQRGESVAVLTTSAVARDAERWSALLGRDVDHRLEPMNATMSRIGKALTATQWLVALETVQAWARLMAATWSEWDLLLLPVVPGPPFALGEMAPGAKDPFSLLADVARIGSLTRPFNLTGDPAISLPLHWTPGNLPVGIQLVAPIGREDRIFQVAGQLERARPWAQRRPDLGSISHSA